MFIGDAFIHTRVDYPDDWMSIPRQRELTNTINQLITAHCDRVYGDVQVNVGELSHLSATQANRLRKTINLHLHGDDPMHEHQAICPVRVGQQQPVFGTLTQLPFAQHSIDAVALINTLDFTHDPHQLLREAERVLRSDGTVIITGFNPLSLSGVLHRLPLYGQHPIKHARFFSQYRVKEWLKVLGFEVKYSQFFGPVNLFAEGSKKQKTQPEQTSQPKQTSPLAMNRFGSMYFIVAQKAEMPMSMIKPKFAKFNPRLQAASASMRLSKKQRSA